MYRIAPDGSRRRARDLSERLPVCLCGDRDRAVIHCRRGRATRFGRDLGELTRLMGGRRRRSPGRHLSGATVAGETE